MPPGRNHVRILCVRVNCGWSGEHVAWQCVAWQCFGTNNTQRQTHTASPNTHTWSAAPACPGYATAYPVNTPHQTPPCQIPWSSHPQSQKTPCYPAAYWLVQGQTAPCSYSSRYHAHTHQTPVPCRNHPHRCHNPRRGHAGQVGGQGEPQIHEWCRGHRWRRNRDQRCVRTSKSRNWCTVGSRVGHGSWWWVLLQK